MATTTSVSHRPRDRRSFLLQRVQPAMVGLIDGSLSTLAPIFAVALATRQPRYAFLAGLATAIGASVSMAFSEGLSDTGELTGRGRSYQRGAITGACTFLGGILHTLPFLIARYRSALLLALAVIAFELAGAGLDSRGGSSAPASLSSFVSVTLGGAVIAAISAALGAAQGSAERAGMARYAQCHAPALHRNAPAALLSGALGHFLPSGSPRRRPVPRPFPPRRRSDSSCPFPPCTSCYQGCSGEPAA